MSVSGKGCEKCGYTGVITFGDGAPWSMKRPCDWCAEPWGPQPLDAPEAVRVEVFAMGAGRLTQVFTTRGTFGPLDVIAPAAKWLRIAAPEVPR